MLANRILIELSLHSELSLTFKIFLWGMPPDLLREIKYLWSLLTMLLDYCVQSYLHVYLSFLGIL